MLYIAVHPFCGCQPWCKHRYTSFICFYFLQVDRYKVAIIEEGTPFTEEIAVDEKREDVEVFRVPSHNNVDGADFYHGFKMVSD